MKKLFACSTLIISLASLPELVQAQVGSAERDWGQATTNTSATGAVAIDHWNTTICDGVVVNAVGSTVYLRLASSGALWGTYAAGGLITNKPVLTKLQDGKWYVFVTADDGKLYKLDVANHGVLATTGGISQIRNCRRPSDSGCMVKDKLDASAVVQLKAESNTGYTLGIDMVMVATHHGCGSYTSNMVYSFDAADITQPAIWVFNQFGDYAVDYFNNFILDSSRNVIFCTTHQTSGVQNTLWRISTITGNPDWGANLGSILNSPVLAKPVAGQPDRLYAADAPSNKLHAINPDNGVEYWNLLLSATPGVYPALPITPGEGAYAGQLLTTLSDGNVYALYDNLDSAELLWTYNPSGQVKVKTGAVILPGSDKCYVGLDDGTIHQLNLASGANEGFCMPYNSIGAAATSNCAEPGIYKTGLRYKIVIAQWLAGGIISQFNIPGFIQNNSPDLNVWTGAVSTAWENPANWTPNRVPVATTDVLIKSGSIVEISSNAVCSKLEIQCNESLVVKPGFSLHIMQ